jgi:hypothetical protein
MSTERKPDPATKPVEGTPHKQTFADYLGEIFFSLGCSAVFLFAQAFVEMCVWFIARWPLPEEFLALLVWWRVGLEILEVVVFVSMIVPPALTIVIQRWFRFASDMRAAPNEAAHYQQIAELAQNNVALRDESARLSRLISNLMDQNRALERQMASLSDKEHEIVDQQVEVTGQIDALNDCLAEKLEDLAKPIIEKLVTLALARRIQDRIPVMIGERETATDMPVPPNLVQNPSTDHQPEETGHRSSSVMPVSRTPDGASG